MTDKNRMKNNSEQRRSALVRVLRAIGTLPAQMLFYGTVLGAVALAVGDPSPDALMGGLALLAANVGVNTLSSILERVARRPLKNPLFFGDLYFDNAIGRPN